MVVVSVEVIRDIPIRRPRVIGNVRALLDVLTHNFLTAAPDIGAQRRAADGTASSGDVATAAVEKVELYDLVTNGTPVLIEE